MTSLPLASWDLAWADVQNYDREGTLASVSDLLRGLTKKHGPLAALPDPGKAASIGARTSAPAPTRVQWSGVQGAMGAHVSAELTERLRAALPNWYGRGSWAVGNETFGSCWCCAFPKEISKGPEEGARWVAGELETMFDAVRAWAPHISAVDEWPVPSTRSVRLYESAGALVDTMVENGWLSEGWYHFVDDGVRWLLNAATGVPTTDPALVSIESCAYAFSSWTAPAAPHRAAFSEGMAALLETLEAREKP